MGHLRQAHFAHAIQESYAQFVDIDLYCTIFGLYFEAEDLEHRGEQSMGGLSLARSHQYLNGVFRAFQGRGVIQLVLFPGHGALAGRVLLPGRPRVLDGCDLTPILDVLFHYGEISWLDADVVLAHGIPYFNGRWCRVHGGLGTYTHNLTVVGYHAPHWRSNAR